MSNLTLIILILVVERLTKRSLYEIVVESYISIKPYLLKVWNWIVDFWQGKDLTK